MLFLKMFFIILCIGTNSMIHTEKIKNLINIKEVNNIQLIGYGLVIGLNDTKNKISKFPLTTQKLYNMLSDLNINDKKFKNFQFKNITSVIVTGNLPYFSHIGDKIDVIISSIENLKNLKNGILLMTPLQGIDKKIYAIAQGRVIESCKNNFNIITKRYKKKYILQPNQMHSGAIIQKQYHLKTHINNIIHLQLRIKNIKIAKKISNIINSYYSGIAKTINNKTIKINFNKNNNLNNQILYNIQNMKIKIKNISNILKDQ
ncbi:Flagellar P-ring protein [Buchnera aphidicola (Phyllaphis fagi)]|uniref:flagellar basal body P-ring protein FlgI n=1 Tax=Buchnera aphidicola TaxID=9 RepID=UPI003464B9DB